jgi:hypothetical protein
LHGGKSTGPKALDGVARIRAANSKHGRFSAESKAVARWEKLYVKNGIRSLRPVRGCGGVGVWLGV